MAEKNSNTSSLFVGLALGVLLVLGFMTFMAANKEAPVQEYPSAGDIAKLIVIPAAPVAPALNDSTVNAIFKQVTEDDAWEDLAEEIATEEWEDNDYKDLYKALDEMFGDIHDEDDIEYVKYDESTDFDHMDADDQDGTVTQYLKVKYEDDDGDDHKVYITVTTDIEDGDIDDQVFEETD